MKTIGMIGGMSWESTAAYYQIINETVREELGGLFSAKCLLYSVDFHEMEDKQTKGDWEGIASDLVEITLGLQKAGADFLVICANTMHKLVPQIQAKVNIPILHIADALPKP
jgi:aspartate racemase